MIDHRNQTESVPGHGSPPASSFRDLVPLPFARRHLVLAKGESSQGPVSLAVSGKPTDAIVAHNIAVRLGRPVTTCISPADEIAAELDAIAETSIAGSLDESDDDSEELVVADNAASLAEAIAASDRDLLETAGRAPIVRLLNAVFFEALRLEASDVHIQPRGEEVVVRIRVDGVLRDAHTLPKRVLDPLVSRVKVMADMDVAERRVPQDGRAAVRIGEKEIDLRVSSIPTGAGERAVIRLLDKRNVDFFRLDRLGMPADVRSRFMSVCARAHGMVLLTGPTGSGKSTTLYSVLRELNAPGVNIMTLEDPIEYELPGISQSQVNRKKGITFATGLRHILRQDPDIIMVGEIRDAETARIAVQSALTGHMVYSTLHTNNAASAVVRLSDLGVEPYLVNASLAAVLAQRLVRRLCAPCDGVGCETCRQTGFKGRVGLYELMLIDEVVRSLIAEGASAGRLHEHATARGMMSLRRAGEDAVAAGITTHEEVARVTVLDEAMEPA